MKLKPIVHQMVVIATPISAVFGVANTDDGSVTPSAVRNESHKPVVGE